MLTKHNYCPLPDNWDNDILECCPDQPAGDPGGSDCCYDSWKKQLSAVERKFRHADEKARRLQKQFDSAVHFRDKYKAWFEDLLKANDLAGYICQHLHVFSAQVDNICCTTQSSVNAINLLFCMVRDFYIRVDELKEEYDDLLNCIKCLNRPELNGGIIDCLGQYYKKLEAVIATRDKIIELMVKAVKISYQLNAAICSRYGLQRIVSEWHDTFNCDYSNSDDAQYRGKHKPADKGERDCTLPETCELVPMLRFPIESDPYFNDLQDQRQFWDNKIRDLIGQLVAANKEKEVLLANKENLVKAIQEVDPKIKCK